MTILLIGINGCNIKSLTQKKGYSFVLNKNKFLIDTLYLNIDSLVINKNMYNILDSFIKKADDLGFNKSVFKANYGISIYDDQILNFNGEWGNIKFLCTDDIEYLNQQFFADIGKKIPVLGGFVYKSQYFIVYHTSEMKIFNDLFSASKEKIDIPYFKIKHLKSGSPIEIFNKHFTVYYKYSENTFKYMNMIYTKY